MQIKSKILKNAEGKIIGISLEPDWESWGERFIGLFPKAFLQKQAEVRIEGDKVVFDNKTLHEQFMVKLKGEELRGLRENVFSGTHELTIELFGDPLGLSGPGFKIVVNRVR